MEAPGASRPVEGVRRRRRLARRCRVLLKDRSVSFIGDDQINDVSPTGFPQQMGLPIHLIALSILGVDIFDNLDLERAAETAKRLNRYQLPVLGRTVADREGNGLAPQSACHF